MKRLYMWIVALASVAYISYMALSTGLELPMTMPGPSYDRPLPVPEAIPSREADGSRHKLSSSSDSKAISVHVNGIIGGGVADTEVLLVAIDGESVSKASPDETTKVAEFKDVANGKYQIVSRHPRYVGQSILAVVDDDNRVFDVQMKRGLSIVGRVLAHDDTVVTDCRIHLRPAMSAKTPAIQEFGSRHTTVPDGEGYFRFEGLPNLKYFVTVRCSDYIMEPMRERLVAPGLDPVRIYIHPLLATRLAVQDDSTGAEIQLPVQSDWQLSSQKSVQASDYLRSDLIGNRLSESERRMIIHGRLKTFVAFRGSSLRPIVSGMLRVAGFAPAHVEAALMPLSEALSSKPVPVRVSRAASSSRCTLRFSYHTGEELEGSRFIDITRSGADSPERSFRLADISEGKPVTAYLLPGRYDVSVGSSSFSMQSAGTIKVEAGHPSGHGFDLRIQRMADVFVQPVDTSREPMSSFELVELRGLEESNRHVRIAGIPVRDGQGFRCRDFPNGKYRVVVASNYAIRRESTILAVRNERVTVAPTLIRIGSPW